MGPWYAAGMQVKTFGSHLLDVVKAAAAVALIQGVIAFLQYVGLHVPPAANLAASGVSGFAAIKAHFG